MTSGKIPPIDGDPEKIKILYELCEKRVISEVTITTTPILPGAYDSKTVTKSKGYSVDRQMAEQLYGIKIPS